MSVKKKKKTKKKKALLPLVGFFWFGLKAADTDARPSLLPRDYVQIDMQIDMQTTCKTTQRRQAKNVEAHKTNTRAQVHTPTHTQAHTKSWMTRNDKLFVLVLTHTHKKKNNSNQSVHRGDREGGMAMDQHGRLVSRRLHYLRFLFTDLCADSLVLFRAVVAAAAAAG